MPKEYVCKICGSLRRCGRKLCRECHNKQKKEITRKARAAKLPKGSCVKCQCEITLFNKNQKFCRKCYIEERKHDLMIDGLLMGDENRYFQKKIKSNGEPEPKPEEKPKEISHTNQLLKQLLEENKQYIGIFPRK